MYMLQSLMYIHTYIHDYAAHSSSYKCINLLLCGKYLFIEFTPNNPVCITNMHASPRNGPSSIHHDGHVNTQLKGHMEYFIVNISPFVQVIQALKYIIQI